MGAVDHVMPAGAGVVGAKDQRMVETVGAAAQDHDNVLFPIVVDLPDGIPRPLQRRERFFRSAGIGVVAGGRDVELGG